MSEFLKLLPPAVALERLMSHLPSVTPPTELISTAGGLGRVTAEPIIAPERLPAFDRSSMDGYAVKAASTYGSSDSLPTYLTLVGEVPMGGAASFSIQSGQAALIHTGGMLPEGADAVVMLENTQKSRPDEVEVLRAVAVDENILKAGEDVSIGEELIPVGARLRPAEIGGLMALGLTQVRVTRRPRFGILSSGDEIIPPDQKPKPGQVRDINSYSLAAIVEENGGETVRYGILPDNQTALEKQLKQALDECDAVLITAGSSASSRDLTAAAIQRMGEPGVLVHGVNVRPGKPTILAVCDGKPVIGMPGNPVSALVIARLFVAPVVEHLLGLAPRHYHAMVSARLAINLPSQAGREEWVPARLFETPQGTLAEPVFFKSNLIFSLARADGLVYIPPDATGLEAGTSVQVILM